MRESNVEARRHAAFGDLRKCLEYAEEMGELEIIEGADPHLEIGTLFELSLQLPVPPILLFRKIKGFPEDYRVAVNVRSSKVLNDGQGLELVQAYRRHRRKNTASIPPEFVQSGPVLSNVMSAAKVDILKFPAPKWHAYDGGGYIGTECMVITKDPDSDWINAGTYRVSVRDSKTLSVFIEPGKHGDTIRKKYWARGEHCPMAISVGAGAGRCCCRHPRGERG
jgi:UbiD family decarboxylase